MARWILLSILFVAVPLLLIRIMALRRRGHRPLRSARHSRADAVDVVATPADPSSMARGSLPAPAVTTSGSELLGRLRRLDEKHSPGLLAQITRVFVQDATTHLTALREGVARGDAATVVRAAHTLQGAASMAGANSLAQRCGDLLGMARTGSFENAGATLEELSAGIEAIRQSLAGTHSPAATPSVAVVEAEAEPSRSGRLPAARRKRVLVVDDDETTRTITQAMVEELGHETETARDGIDALSKLPLGIDLVLLDVMMPGLDGFLVCRCIRQDSYGKDIPVIMVTSMASREDRLNAVEAGANDFITKPVDETELRVRLRSILKMKEAQDEVRRYQGHLEDMVEQRTASLRKALEGMAEAQRLAYLAQLETVERLAIVAEYKDQVTAKHIRRMSEYCAVIARGLNLPPREVELILHASRMHDVGKIAVPDAILQKPASLDASEWVVMRRHPTVGSKILDRSSSEVLEAGRVIALYHHERWDGAGYPGGFSGENIPLWGRICAVADVFDAVTSERPYKPAYPNEEALRILREGRGTQFDPHVVDVFLECLEEVLAIQSSYNESGVKTEN